MKAADGGAWEGVLDCELTEEPARVVALVETSFYDSEIDVLEVDAGCWSVIVQNHTESKISHNERSSVGIKRNNKPHLMNFDRVIRGRNNRGT